MLIAIDSALQGVLIDLWFIKQLWQWALSRLLQEKARSRASVISLSASISLRLFAQSRLCWLTILHYFEAKQKSTTNVPRNSTWQLSLSRCSASDVALISLQMSEEERLEQQEISWILSAAQYHLNFKPLPKSLVIQGQCNLFLVIKFPSWLSS